MKTKPYRKAAYLRILRAAGQPYAHRLENPRRAEVHPEMECVLAKNPLGRGWIVVEVTTMKQVSCAATREKAVASARQRIRVNLGRAAYEKSGIVSQFIERLRSGAAERAAA